MSPGSTFFINPLINNIAIQCHVLLLTYLAQETEAEQSGLLRSE